MSKPKQKIRYINTEMSLTDRDLNIFNTCGIKEKVVHAAAIQPKNSIRTATLFPQYMWYYFECEIIYSIAFLRSSSLQSMHVPLGGIAL